MPDSLRPAGDPLLSVLVASWNAAPTIERALASVLAETSIPLECVVVDDGSDDGTADLVAAVARRDPRVRLVRSSANLGVSNARNIGLGVVRGEWLTFLDADDRFLPGGIAALMAPTRDPTVRAIVGQRVWWNGEHHFVSPLYDIPDIREPGRKSLAGHPGLLYYASATGKAFHRSLLGGLAFEGRVLGDQPWTIRALLRAGDGIEVVADDVYEWTRPAPGEFLPTITSRTRSSAARLAQSARVARTAFLQVAAEADAQLDDPGERLEVKRVYAERLVRSDFAVALGNAISRRDPGLAGLFTALGDLLAIMPPETIAGSDAVLRDLLRPAWRGWTALPASARRAWWTMLGPVRRADPVVAVRLVRSRRLAPALELARGTTLVNPALGALVVRSIRALSGYLEGRRARSRGSVAAA